MSASKDNTQNPEFDIATQEQAYYELCQIIAEALQAQDLEMLEVAIYYWENQYPIEKFDNSYKEKIRRLLSNEYLAWLKQYIQSLADIARRCKEFDPVKAYDRLIKILVSEHRKGNFARLQEKIDAWKTAYPIDKFSAYYKSKISEKTSKKYLQKTAELFSEKEALDELEKIVRSVDNISILKCKIRDWKLKFPEAGFSEKNKSAYETQINNSVSTQSKTAVGVLSKIVTDLRTDISSGKKGFSDLSSAISHWQSENKFEDIAEQFYPQIKELTDNGYLSQANSTFADIKLVQTHVGPLNQERAYLELTNALLSADFSQKTLEWIYRYGAYIRYFDDYHIGLIFEKTNNYFRVPKSGLKTVTEIDTENCSNINDAKKAVTLQFLSHLYHKTPLLGIETARIKNVYTKTVAIQQLDAVSNTHVDEIKDIITNVNTAIYETPTISKNNKKVVMGNDLEIKTEVPISTSTDTKINLHQFANKNKTDNQLATPSVIASLPVQSVDIGDDCKGDIGIIDDSQFLTDYKQTLLTTEEKELYSFTTETINSNFTGKKMERSTTLSLSKQRF